jgi:hypothetical protein
MARRKRRRLRGLGVLKVGFGRDLIPPAVGLGLSAGTTFAIRSIIQPSPGTPGELLYRHAPWVGAGVGVLGGMAVGILGGKGQAASAIMTSVVTSVVLVGMDMLNAKKPGALAALLGGGNRIVGDDPATPGEMAGLRAIVPEYPNRAFSTGTQGLNAIVMEQLNGLRGNQQNQGADVQLRGVVNTGAFGSTPFGG